MIVMSDRTSREIHLLFTIGFLHMLSVTIGGAITPAYIKDLGGSDASVGYLISVFYLIRGCFTMLAGGISDRIGRRKPIIVSLAIFGISQLSYSFCQEPRDVSLCIALQAVAAGIYWPSILSYIAQTSTPTSHAKNISRFFVLVGLGGFLGSWIGGYVAETHSPRVSYLLGCMAFTIPLIVSVCLAEGEDFRETADKVALQSLFRISRPLLTIIVLASAGVIPRATFFVGYALRLRSLGGDYSVVGTVYGISMLIGLLTTALVPNWGRYMGFANLILISIFICALSALANGAARVLWVPCVLLPLLWGAVMTGEVAWVTYIQGESSEKALGTATGLLRGAMDVISVLYSAIFGALSNTLNIGAAFISSAVGISIVFEVTRRYFQRRTDKQARQCLGPPH